MRTEIVLVVFAVFFIAAPGCGGTGVETSKGLGPDLSADMGADTAVHIEVSEVAPEVDVLDLRADLPDAMPDIHQCLEKPFELFCPCQSDAECASGYCIQVPTGIGGGKVCTMACVEDCPEGWQCALVAGSCPDCTFVCIPWGAVLCHPCHEHSDCGDPEVESPDLCVPYGPQGRFCGADCGGGKKCPDGYVCQNVQLDGGAGATQCVLADGECECSEEDIANETSTICFHADLTGNKCFGLRVCTADGLSECDAQTPVPETCNGKDDDCDGWLDEATCDDENSCTDNVCDPVAGCQFPPNESACEDGDPCTSGDKCTQGKCEGGINVCPCMKDGDCPGLGFVGGCVGKLFCDTSAMPHGCKVDPAGATPCAAPANQCKAVTCNVATGQCDQANKPELTPCDDGDACTAFDWCEGGACVGGQLVHCSDGNSCTEDGCSAESGCTYMPLSGVACTDGDPCTDGDSCVDGECVVGPSMSCDDGNLCTDDACMPGTGCKHVANQLPCDDANVCTLDDVCAAGWCMSKTLLKCDDGNPCTDDVCDPLVGCISTVNMNRAATATPALRVTSARAVCASRGPGCRATTGTSARRIHAPTRCSEPASTRRRTARTTTVAPGTTAIRKPASATTPCAIAATTIHALWTSSSAARTTALRSSASTSR